MPIPINGLGTAIDKVITEHAGVKKNNENIIPEIIEEKEEKIYEEPQNIDIEEDDLDKPLNINELIGYNSDIIIEEAGDPDAYDAKKMQTALSDVSTFLSTLYYYCSAVPDDVNADLLAEASVYCLYLKSKANGTGEFNAEKEGYRESFDKAITFLTETNEKKETGLTQIMNSALNASYRRGEDNSTVPLNADAQEPDNSVRAISERLSGYRALSKGPVSKSQMASTVDYVVEADKFVKGLKTLSEMTNTDMKSEIISLEKSANAQKKKLIDYKCDCILASVKGIQHSVRWRRNSTEYETMSNRVLSMIGTLQLFKEASGRQDTPENQEYIKTLAGSLKEIMNNVREATKAYILAKSGGDDNWKPMTKEGKKRYALAKSMDMMTKEFIKNELEPLTAEVRAVKKQEEPPKKKRPTRNEDEKRRFTEALKLLAKPAEYGSFFAFSDEKKPVHQMTDDKGREIARDAAADIIAANIIHNMHKNDSLGENDFLESSKIYSKEAIGFVSNFVKRCKCFQNLPDYPDQNLPDYPDQNSASSISDIVDQNLLDYPDQNLPDDPDQNSVRSISDIIFDASRGIQIKIKDPLLNQVMNEMSGFTELQSVSMQNQFRNVFLPNAEVKLHETKALI